MPEILSAQPAVPGPATRLDDEGLWPVFSHPRVRAYMSTRRGGVSHGSFASFNLRQGIGDDPEAVSTNRQRLQELTGVPSVRVNQVHGSGVHRLPSEGASGADGSGERLPVADALVTDRLGLACEIHVADCLPVLFADTEGRAVAAAHAGWRGLAAGVLEASVSALCEGRDIRPGQIEAWLGPCIGPRSFEVGIDVLHAFGADPADPGRWFLPMPQGRVDRRASGPAKWWADLVGLARQRLVNAGVVRIGGNDGGADWCTFGEAGRYYSYRRDRHTGRMAALVWLDDRQA